MSRPFPVPLKTPPGYNFRAWAWESSFSRRMVAWRDLATSDNGGKYVLLDDGAGSCAENPARRACSAQGGAVPKGKTPRLATRAKCRDCAEGNRAVVRRCPFDGQQDRLCALHALRMGKGTGRKGLLRAIRKKCLWCCNNQRKEVGLCPSTLCALWPYRLGKRPKTVAKAAGQRKGVQMPIANACGISVVGKVLDSVGRGG